MALSFEEIKNKVTGQQRSGTESFDEIKARVSQMNMTSPLTADDVDAWFAKSRELEGKTNQYLSDSGTYDGWKGASSPYDELHKHRLQEASVRAWLNSNKDALGDRYDALSAQLGDYSGGLGRLSSGIRDTSANWRNSPIGELDASISANEQKLTELRAQLDETGDQWHKKTLSSLLSERKPIQNQIKELESENNRLQDELNAYKKEYFEASIPSDPDGIKKMEADIDAKIAALQSKLDAKPFEKGPGKILSKILTDEGMKVVQPQDENAIAQEIKTLKDQKEQLNNALKRVEYAQIPKAEDFEEFAKYVPSKDDESKMGFWEKMGSRLTGGGYDRDYEYINDENGARAEIKSYISNMRSDSPSLWEDGSSSQERAGYDFITDDEVKIYNYIYAKQGKQAAKDYLDTLDLTARARGDDRIKWEQMANENAPLASTLSVLAGQYKPAGYIESVKDYITGQGIDPNSHYNRYSKAQSTVRETVSKNIEDSVEGVWGKVGSFGYQTGMSMADFLLSLIAGGGNQSFTLAVMGSGAAADTVISAKEKGLDDTRAFALGTLAGAAEVVFEKVSLDHLFKIKSKAGIASKILDVLSQAGVEGSEEIFTDIANELADRLISGDLSDYSLTVKSYIDAGLSETEAKKKANVDFAEQLALSGLGGFLSGGVLGAGAVTLNNTIGTRAIGRDVIRSGDVNSTIGEGLNLDVNDPLYRAAAELAMRQTEGGKLSARKVGELETGLEAKALDRLESLRGQMARILSGDTQNGDETAPLGTVYTKSKTAQNGPSNAQDGHSANADVQTNVPYTVNVEAAKPLDAQARMGNSAVTVQGVESVQDGDVTVTLSDGTKVPLYDVEIADPQIRQLYDTAAKYDTNTAKAFVSGFDGSLPISTYQSAFDYFMTQAKHGVSMDEAMQHAGLAGQMMSPVSRQTAYFAGENLQSSGSRGNMGAENVATGGMNRVSEGFDRGRETGASQYPGISGRVRENNSAREGTAAPDEGARRNQAFGRDSARKAERNSERGGLPDREHPARTEKKVVRTDRGKARFEAVRESDLSPKQRAENEVAKAYGYELYHVPYGTEVRVGDTIETMDSVAFVKTGTNLIFAQDGTDLDFIHHELFHQFYEGRAPLSGELFVNTEGKLEYGAKQWQDYWDRCKATYKKKTTYDIVYEEITCDLCEYAMSGSEKMYNRLNGLFEGDTLETLAEQAREVFEANREAAQKNTAVETDGGTRYYLEEYTDHQKENWAGSKSIVVYESDAQLEQFIDDALNKRNLDKKMYFGRVPFDLAQRVMDETGMDIDGYNCTIQAQEIRKILVHSHGNEAFERARGQRAITKEDIINIPEVISSPDSISLSPKLYEGKPVIRFSKTINGRTTVVSYVSKKHRDLAVQTMYASAKKGSLATATDAPMSGPLSLTPETTGGTASNNSIGENPDTVNTSIPKSPEKDTGTRFYMDDAVEEVRGIRAYHGMTTEDLDSAVQSGLPPLHTDGAGDISLLFRPEASLSYDTETPVQDTGFGARLSSIAGRMAGGRTADAMESSRVLLDVLSRSHTKEDIRKSLESLGKFSVTDEIVADIFSLSNDMAESPGMVYRDAAGLEDVAAAVVPDTLDEDLKTQLEAAGIKTVEYKAGDDADRVRALNEAPELRFYLEDISPVDVDLLTEENQALREQVETLRGEFQLTKGHKVKPASIGKLADTILKETSSSYDKGTLVKNLDALFSYIANDPDANFDEAMDVSVEIANSVLRESSALDSTLYEKYRDMREYFRKTAISLDEDIRAGMDYERFRKEHFGGFRLTNDGASLDSLWPEISGRWPEFFSPDTPIQDQPQAVADALRTVKPSYVNPYGMDATEAAYDLAMRVYEEYFNLPEIHTFADKKKAELTQLRAKYENRIQAIRKGYKAKEQALVQEQRQKRKDLKDENRLRLAAQMEKVREQRKAAADKRWESALVRRYKPRIIRDTMELGRWLTHPTDKKHVPEPFRKAVAEFVNTIDFSSDRLNSKGKPTMRTMAMQKLFNQMNTILKSESGTFEEAQAIFDGADPDLIPNMADLIQNAERVRIEDMTGTQLGELAHVVAALKSMLTNANTLISGERTRAAEQVAKGIHMDLMGQEAKEYTGLLGLGKRLVNYDMMDAPSYFEELGETAYREIYKPLRRGFDRKIQNTTEAVAYMQRLLKGIDTDTWSGTKAEKHTFKVRGGTVSLTTAQIMSLYELSKRDQARGHILGGGIRPSDTVKKMRIDKTFRPVTLTAQDLKEIVGTLTPEQRAVADGIADFFKVTAEWGNEVSMKLYGYRKFTEQNYFPIVSDKNYLTTMQGDLKRPDAVLKNLGMTKSTVAGANNPIMVEDIFDVFTRQADQMGSYNAFVVPLSDLSKVFNFKASEPGGEVQGSIKESLERALGHDAVAYWNKLVEDINGVSKQTPPTIGDKLLSNMKAAAVGANLRVIIQQPTAYLRAAALIDPKYLAKGLATKSDIDEMNEYAPIAYWKDLGFFEMDTARGMKDILMGKKGLRDIAMKPAGWADTKTWGKLWNAVKAEIRDTTDFKPGTVEFLEAAGERFSEIIDRTQVVDSVLHRSQMMRSKNFINKTVTSFMSEPTKAYNMLRSAVRDVQKNGWKKGRRRLVRVTVAHTATSILTALLAALVDAIRDDDEEKKWWEKYLSAVGENTLDNLSPLNMLPYLKDVASLLSGYNLTRQEMAGLTDVVNAGRAWMSYFQGDSKYSVAWLIKNSAASISKLTGIPVAAATRDLEALVGGSIRTLGDFGVPTARLEYILDTFYYPVNSKNASRYAGRAYDAYRENNPKLAKDIMEAMEKGGISEEKIVYYMRKNLRERDDRIAEAGRAKLDGNMSAYARIVGEIRNDGFDREWVVGAVDGWVSKLESAAKEKADGKTKELKESLEEITDGGADQEWAEDAVNRLADSQKKRPANDADDEEEYEGLFEGSDVVMALEAGNTKEAKAVIQEMTDNGKEESSIRSAVTRYYKPIYQDLYKRKDEAGMRKLRETLVGLGIGYKSGDFTRWIQDMEK
jgi:hypothetical protein